ncbi:MAG TPA: hypothetical protein VMV31_10845 [Terriglobales bacterium]|nr:hypothetical protein [Terriglobales bacterium]
MRAVLPNLRPNGHPPQPARVFVITGMCQQPSFRLRQIGDDDFCLIHLGAAQFGEPGEDPYFLLRRSFDQGAAVAALRVEWEGVFTLLANDDLCADHLFQELVEPGAPEEVQRQWSDDPATAQMFADWLLQA